MIKILDKSEVKEKSENTIEKKTNDELKKKDEKNESNIDKISKIDSTKIEKKNKLNFIPNEKMRSCGRSAQFGLTNNCVLCQNKNKDIFDKCPNKWI